jgi:hypothetical protein
MQFQCQRKSRGWIVLGTPPAYIGDGSDYIIIERYVIDEELIGMVGECIQPTVITIMHTTDGKR